MKQNPSFDQEDIVTVQDMFQSNYLSESKIIHLLPFVVYICDTSGVIVNYNSRAAELWGKNPNTGDTESNMNSQLKISTTENNELTPGETPVAECLRGEKISSGIELVIETSDGSRKIFKSYVSPFIDAAGNFKGVINVMDDITESKVTKQELHDLENRYQELTDSQKVNSGDTTSDLIKKNEELKRSEERYHKMIEEVEDYAIILLDKNGIIQNWNNGAAKIKGYKEEEIVGKSFKLFYLPQDRENCLPDKLLNEAVNKGKAIHEGWRMRKDGSRFWGSIVLTALHDNQNNIIGFSKVTRDLTDRKMAQDKMEEYTSQLEFQNKELEQFAYAASHDMKEPLRKIHLYNSSISENPANILDDRSREYLSRSLNAVKRMTDLIEDLLTYSKTTATIESFEEVDLNEVVDEIVLLHKDEFEQKKVEIEVDKLPTIHAVPFQIKQLMFNLFNNSIKYKHPDRNVRIEIKNHLVKGTDINEYGADSLQNYHKISIIDNGVGFETQYTEKIFDIFQRLNNLPGSKGSGIGLAICKRIVQNHHGFIKASGKENQGAKFEIYLPQNM